MPSTYRADQKNALYLKGRQVSVDGYTDVAGFLPAKRGHLVAVYQRSQRDGNVIVNTPDGGWVVGFYLIGKDGKKQKQVGSIDRAVDVIVAKDAIYVERLDRENNKSWVGYTPAGEEVAGPSGARFATPYANGDWAVERWTQNERSVLYRDRKNGESDVVGEINHSSGRRFQFVHSIMGAVVNEPNYVDSVRTGLVLAVERESTTTGRDFAGWWALVIDLNKTANDVVRIYDARVEDYRLGDNMELDERRARTMTRRLPLIKIANKMYLGVQYQERGFAPALNYGLSDLTAKKPDKAMVKLFKVMDAGFNFFRGLLGRNGTDMSQHSQNEVYVIITPETIQVATADQKLEKSQRRVINLADFSESPFSAGTFSRYGMTR